MRLCRSTNRIREGHQNGGQSLRLCARFTSRTKSRVLLLITIKLKACKAMTFLHNASRYKICITTCCSHLQGYSCVDLLNAGMRESGVYYLQIRGTTYWFLKVYCEQNVADGGWTVSSNSSSIITFITFSKLSSLVPLVCLHN